jgi:hypothetical protein
MDKFVKKWKSDSNAGSSSHRSAKNEKQTPVERAFSAMKIIKTDLRNKIGDDFLYHCLITYVKIDVGDCGGGGSDSVGDEEAVGGPMRFYCLFFNSYFG